MPSLRGLCLALVILAACGRIDFDAYARDSIDAIDSAPPACTLGPWSAPRHQTNLRSVDNDWEGSIHPNRLVVVFGRHDGVHSDLLMATRADPSADFGSPTAVGALNTSSGTDYDWGPTWSPDGKTFYWRHTGGTDSYFEATFDPATNMFSNKRASTLPAGFSWELTPDGAEVFYTTEPSQNQFDLHHAKLIGTNWVDDLQVDHFNSPTAAEGWPTFDAARQTLYFESDMTGTDAVYATTRADALSDFGPAQPVALGTTGNGDPDLSDDALEMMYAADNGAGPSDSDLYIVTRACQ